MCGYVHRSIERVSNDFWNQLRRRVYTTPKSYLDLISLYMSMLKGLQDVVELKSERMKVGVVKLNETNSIVDSLRGELVKLGPVLKAKAAETEVLLAQVAKDSAEAKIVADTVGAEEAIVGKQAAETQAVAADAQKDLDRALPALESAVKALKGLTKADITEVKSFTNPPTAVRIVMEAVCVMLGEKESWDNAKKVLGRSDFMELLTGYDKDNIAEAKLKKLRKQYIPGECKDTLYYTSSSTTPPLLHLHLQILIIYILCTCTYPQSTKCSLRLSRKCPRQGSVCVCGYARWMSIQTWPKKSDPRKHVWRK